MLGSPGLSQPTKATLTGLQTAITDAEKNIFRNFFSGITGGTGSSSQQVNLKLNTQISLSGNLTNSVGITNPFLVIPGESNQTTANGPIPNYLKTMGVFNISAKPAASITHSVLAVIPPGTNPPNQPVPIFYLQEVFNPVNNSNLIFYNPTISSLASLIVEKQDLLVTNIPNYGNFGGYTLQVSGGTQETIAGILYYVNPTSIKYTVANSNLQTVFVNTVRAYVRFVIKVTPSNGAPVSRIIKSFPAHF